MGGSLTGTQPVAILVKDFGASVLHATRVVLNGKAQRRLARVKREPLTLSQVFSHLGTKG